MVEHVQINLVHFADFNAIAYLVTEDQSVELYLYKRVSLYTRYTLITL